jgi:hypothetical protein
MTRKPQSDWDWSRLNERILHDPALTLRESLPDTGAWRTVFQRLLTKVRREVQIEVRTGYQDETGFHNGVKPVKNEIQWPPVW